MDSEFESSALQRVPGHCTQYPSTDVWNKTTKLVIGLDFGTAYTKVVIGAPRRAYAVPFHGSVHGSNPYLLPGTIAIADDRRVRLGVDGEGRGVSNLKMRILGGDTDDETLSHAVAFLALVLRHARAWFLNTHQRTYGRSNLDWNVNVGLPTSHYQNERLADFYKSIVKAAWHASARAVALDLHGVCDSFADDEGALDQHIGAFPEFAAQINGYVRSPMRRSDLHLLMDVGAGTVDVAAFNVHQQDGEDLFPVFSGVVKPHGVRMLQQHRIQQASQRGHLNVRDGVQFADDASDGEVAQWLGMTIAELKSSDLPFRLKLSSQVHTAVALAREHYPTSPRWRQGVTFFLCGGGARAELYADLAMRMARGGVPCPLARLELPRPERLAFEEGHACDYDRLSVAYGLSFDQFNIGEIVLPGSGHADPPPPRNSIECPACKGTGGLVTSNGCLQCGGSGRID